MKLSINKKISLLSLCGILSISFFSFLTINKLFSDLIKSSKEIAKTSSETINNGIQDQFFERYGDVQTFALRFENQAQSREENEHFLNKFSMMYGIYDLIIVTNLDGHVLGVNNVGPNGNKIDSSFLYSTNFSNASWFRGVKEKKYLEDKEKGFEGVYFEDAHFDPLVEKVYGKKRYTTIFSTYIYNNNGIPIGIISNHANFKWIENIYLREYESNSSKDIFNFTEFNLLDKNGNILIDFNSSIRKKINHDENILNKVNLFEQIGDEDIQKSKIDFHEIKNSIKNINQYSYLKLIEGKKFVNSIGWSNLVRVNKQELLEPLFKIFFIIVGIFSLLFLIACYISIRLSKILSQKLMNLGNKLYDGGKK